MKIAVVGAYQTKFGELWDRSLADLMKEAIDGCLQDGDLLPRHIQAAYVGNMLSGMVDGQQHLSSLVSQVIGESIPVTRVEAACASGGMALRTAVMAIESGMIESALVLGVEKMTDVDGATITQGLMGAAGSDELQAGLSFPALYALMASQYITDFEISETELAAVAVKNHHHGSLNKYKAHFAFPVTSEQVLASPAVADPLKVLDCSPISDGAAAVFICSKPWLKKHHKRNGVCITGSAHCNDALSLSHRRSLLELPATIQATKAAYVQAGIDPHDVSCAEVHDCFSIAEVLAVEDLGFYQKGMGHRAATQKATWLGSRLPINTSGGLKACGHPVGATGIKQVVEVTQQLRGEANGRQVEGAQVAVTHNVGGTGGTAVVHVLQR
jgi:acetyl-CoA C-acetyltransferase